MSDDNSMDDGRWIVGLFGFGALAVGAAKGSLATLSEPQRIRQMGKRKWGRWNDTFWAEVVSGPATKVPADLQGAYYVLTAEWIGDGTLEDKSVAKLWLKTLPSEKSLDLEEMVQFWNLLDKASSQERQFYARRDSIKDILENLGKSVEVEVRSEGARFVSLPDWQFLPGVLSVLPNGSLVVEARIPGAGALFYVVTFRGNEMYFESKSQRPSGTSRGSCPASFMDEAQMNGQVYAFACGGGTSAASFLTSRRLLIVR
jgi:hypothetical protein